MSMYRRLLPFAVVMLLHCRFAAGSFQFASLTDLSSEQAPAPMSDNRASQIMEAERREICVCMLAVRHIQPVLPAFESKLIELFELSIWAHPMCSS